MFDVFIKCPQLLGQAVERRANIFPSLGLLGVLLRSVFTPILVGVEKFSIGVMNRGPVCLLLFTVV